MQLQTWKIRGHPQNNNESSGMILHLGRQGMGQENSGIHLPSDSLMAAVIASLAKVLLPEEVELFTRKMMDTTPPFVISSAFPFAGMVRFFPTPSVHSPIEEANSTDLRVRPKDLKKISFVSEKIFNSILNGSPLSQIFDTENLLMGGKILISKKEKEKLPIHIKKGLSPIWEVGQRPRVTIDRIQNSTTLFHSGQTTYAQECGLWFAIRWLRYEPEIEKLFQLALQILEDEGIGGDRSSGYGRVHFEMGSEIDLPDPTGKHWVSLGRYHPDQDELSSLLDKNAHYSIESIGGWLQAPGIPSQRRKTIHMVLEGSVIGPVEKEAPGSMVDIRPVYISDGVEINPIGHAVLRNGVVLGAGIELKTKGRR